MREKVELDSEQVKIKQRKHLFEKDLDVKCFLEYKDKVERRKKEKMFGIL